MAGNVVHYEISATDVDRAQGFWSGLFGWQFGESVMPDGDYRMARTGEQSGVALSSYGEPGNPNVYFDVDDMDAAIARVRELGGQAEEKQPVRTSPSSRPERRSRCTRTGASTRGMRSVPCGHRSSPPSPASASGEAASSRCSAI